MSVRIEFVKMHGAANDFVVIDHRRPVLPEGAERARLVAQACDRRRGIGADGVLLLEADPELDFAMRYYNSDGAPADYCGNGARCLARFAFELGLGARGEVRFRTAMGPQAARHAVRGRIAVHVGGATGGTEPLALTACGRRFEGRLFRAGVPHFVVPVARVAEVPLAEWAPPLRRDAAFGAEGANVDFVAPLEEGGIAMRTWERGVEGETLACGSGAIATALWAATQGSPSPVRVRTAGGDELEVAFSTTSAGWDVTLTGPAEIAFTGAWSPSEVSSSRSHDDAGGSARRDT